MTTTYPNINRLGLQAHQHPIQHVKWEDIRAALGPIGRDKFQRWMQGKTCIAEGAYAWDVEEFLNRLKGS